MPKEFSPTPLFGGAFLCFGYVLGTLWGDERMEIKSKRGCAG